jgi:hypothetical protein
MVTRAQPGLDADVEVFRSLARHHDGHFGVWSDVLEAGWLSVGDRAMLEAGRSHEGVGQSSSQVVRPDMGG